MKKLTLQEINDSMKFVAVNAQAADAAREQELNEIANYFDSLLAPSEE